MIRWVVAGRLARSCRPGYEGGRRERVPEEAVEAWRAEARAMGLRSILCLLAPEHLDLYAGLPGGLLGFYEAGGFEVAHVPVADHQWPPLDDIEMAAALRAFRSLPAPVVVHCSAGVDRTGAVVERIVAGLDAE